MSTELTRSRRDMVRIAVSAATGSLPYINASPKTEMFMSDARNILCRLVDAIEGRLDVDVAVGLASSFVTKTATTWLFASSHDGGVWCEPSVEGAACKALMAVAYACGAFICDDKSLEKEVCYTIDAEFAAHQTMRHTTAQQAMENKS